MKEFTLGYFKYTVNPSGPPPPLGVVPGTTAMHHWELVRNAGSSAQPQIEWIKICIYTNCHMVCMNIKVKQHFSSLLSDTNNISQRPCLQLFLRASPTSQMKDTPLNRQ